MEFEDMDLKTFTQEMHTVMREQLEIEEEAERKIANIVKAGLLKPWLRAVLRHWSLLIKMANEEGEEIEHAHIEVLAGCMSVYLEETIKSQGLSLREMKKCLQDLVKEIIEVFSLTVDELDIELEKVEEKLKRLGRPKDE